MAPGGRDQTRPLIAYIFSRNVYCVPRHMEMEKCRRNSESWVFFFAVLSACICFKCECSAKKWDCYERTSIAAVYVPAEKLSANKKQLFLRWKYRVSPCSKLSIYHIFPTWGSNPLPYSTVSVLSVSPEAGGDPSQARLFHQSRNQWGTFIHMLSSICNRDTDERLGQIGLSAGSYWNSAIKLEKQVA